MTELVIPASTRGVCDMVEHTADQLLTAGDAAISLQEHRLTRARDGDVVGGGGARPPAPPPKLHERKPLRVIFFTLCVLALMSSLMVTKLFVQFALEVTQNQDILNLLKSLLLLLREMNNARAAAAMASNVACDCSSSTEVIATNFTLEPITAEDGG